MAAPDFWSNRERAQADVEEVSRLRSLINPFQELEREIEDFDALQNSRRKKAIPPRALMRRRKSRPNTTAWLISWRSSSCASFFPAKTIVRMRLSRSIPARAERNRAIGPTCCCGCISAGSNAAVLNRRPSTFNKVKKSASNRSLCW